jgi:hypothetical protein
MTTAQITLSSQLVTVVSKKSQWKRSPGAASARTDLVLAAAARTRLARGGSYPAHCSRGGARPRAAHCSRGGAHLHTSRASSAQLAAAGVELALRNLQRPTYRGFLYRSGELCAIGELYT